MRKTVFMAMEKLKGGGIPRQLNDIEALLSDPSALKEEAGRRLEKLLEHACSTTPYYRKFKGSTRLREFPVIRKETVRENYPSFFSTAYKKRSLISTHTSGSYGTPFTFYLTPEKKSRQLAEVIHFGRWVGYDIGVKHALVRISPKNKLSMAMQNQIIINPTHMDERWFERQRNILQGKSIEVIIGFPSVIGPLASYCHSRGDGPRDFNLRGIVLTGDPLAEAVREKIEEVFGGIVLSRYATEELGVLAHECVAGRRHHLNLASYVFELLATGDDCPVAPGEPGRVVVTDLFSHAMPLIRYETGDLAILSAASCPCGLELPFFERVEGRSVETVYDPQGGRISPYAISCSMQDLSDILQFQFIQEGEDSYTMKLRTLKDFAQQGMVRERLLKILGEGARLKIDYVSSIPPLPSGKRPYVVNKHRVADR
ncbi:MAG: phenylacetate--CoA ligase family protein [Firmicutes bacterium]|nr:phenylacetate--CoA ligase family protein [Bacillota bacterium]